MHDWTLVSVRFDWGAARATLAFRGPDGVAAAIVADGVRHVDVPHRSEWGPSVSVNRVFGPIEVEEDGRRTRRLAIEMQSGDVIGIVADAFALPHAARNEANALEGAAAGE